VAYVDSVLKWSGSI